MILYLTYLTSKQLNDDTRFSRAHKFSWVRAAQYLTFCILFYRQFFDFLFLSQLAIGMVCVSIYSFSVALWYLQPFLLINSSNNNEAIICIFR